MSRFHHTLKSRMMAVLLMLICVFGLLPASALAADTNTIKLERFGMSGVSYESASLGACSLHQMYYDYGGTTTVGFCGTKGGGMGASLIGQTWGNPREITDPTVQVMMAYYYAHSTGVFTDEAKALGVDTIWDAGYTWYMNAWVQAIIWRYQAGTLGNPVVGCAEELMAVYNSLENTNYTSIDQEKDGSSFRSRAQYILDLGSQVWGDCAVYEYSFTGAGSSAHPASSVQKVIIGDLSVTTAESYTLIIKKVDSTNPTKGLPGAEFHIESINGSYSKDVVTGPDGTYHLDGLTANTYAVTETSSPTGYEIDNAGPEYVALPGNGSNTVTVTFTDTPIITGSGSIRKVDADDPSRGLAGAVIEIEGIDNNFVGEYVTVEGGALADVPWDTMPIGSFVATEVTPPTGYTTSPDPNKVRQEFYWDGKSDVDLVFENDAKVKIRLLKLDDSDRPLAGAVFHVVKDGQIIATEKTDASGSIIVPNVTEGMYAFIEVSVPAPFATLTEPVIAHVNQATVDGGGTVTVTAVDQKLPNLTILKRDGQTGAVIPDTVFEVKGIHYGYHMDVTTGRDGKAILTGLPVDSYEVTEKSVPDPYVVSDEPTQAIWLGPGDDQELIFDNLKQPQITIAKVDAADSATPIPGTVFNGIYRTDENGEIRITGLKPGKSVVVTETRAPDGFIIDTQSQTIQIKEGRTVSLIFKNQPKGQLIIQKRGPNNEPLPGAEFRVTTAAGCEVGLDGVIGDSTLTQNGIFTTDSQGEIRISNLAPGAYVLTEIKAPPGGYVIDQPSTNVVIGPNGDTQTVVVKNSKAGSLVILKEDSLSGKPLEGVTFKVTTSTGEFVPDENGKISSNGLYITDQEGKITINGVVGTLVVTETRTIPGYTIDPGTV